MLPFIKEAVQQLFSKPSTEKYPAVDAPAPEGYRGRIVFHADRCISCGMCERVCAGGAISTTAVDTEEGQLITRRFFLGSCTFCANCADFCVKNAIELTTDYHMVARDESRARGRGHLPQEKARAQEAGRRRARRPPAAAEPETPGRAAARRRPARQRPEQVRLLYPLRQESARPAPSPWTAPPRPGTLDEDKCIGCGTCQEVCPKKCIIM